MSAPADKTREELAALCASQAIVIEDLLKEKHEMTRTIKLMDEESAKQNVQATAATAVINALLVIKKEYLVVVNKLRELVPHAQHEHTEEMLLDAEMLEHKFVDACENS